MLIDDIDFARLYQQQLALAGRKEKPSAHWDARAENIAIVDAPVIDSYLRQLLAKIDLHGASSLFDMGCGPGTVALALASRFGLWSVGAYLLSGAICTLAALAINKEWAGRHG